MKDTGVKKKGNKFDRPQKGMWMNIKKKVVNERHNFTAPDTTMLVGSRTMELDESAFQPAKEDHSMEWGKIVGAKPVPPYYSPKGDNFSHSIADMKLLDTACNFVLFLVTSMPNHPTIAHD